MHLFSAAYGDASATDSLSALESVTASDISGGASKESIDYYVGAIRKKLLNEGIAIVPDIEVRIQAATRRAYAIGAELHLQSFLEGDIIARPTQAWTHLRDSIGKQFIAAGIEGAQRQNYEQRIEKGFVRANGISSKLILAAFETTGLTGEPAPTDGHCSTGMSYPEDYMRNQFLACGGERSNMGGGSVFGPANIQQEIIYQHISGGGIVDEALTNRIAAATQRAKEIAIGMLSRQQKAGRLDRWGQMALAKLVA